jgi:anaphase-promoting complex subunit 6
MSLLFIGMEQITLSNFPAADEALAAAHSMCKGDPLLINERGVMAFNHGK